MKVLDLFCGAGGAAMGLHRAWPDAEIIGVDIKPQRHYPFTFIQADATTFPLNGFDFIWASPPCQHYSAGRYWVRGKQSILSHPDLISLIRERMNETPWIIENVEGAPLKNPITLCGSMFSLKCGKGYLRRHRLFEASFTISQPNCAHNGTAVGVYGHGAGSGLWGHRKANAAEARELLQINWMNRDEMNEAIPPAFSEYIGRQFLANQSDLLTHIRAVEADNKALRQQLAEVLDPTVRE